MAITESRMTQLTGPYADLNKSNMLVGEMAVPSDHVPIVRNGVNSWEDLLTSQSTGEIIALSETIEQQIADFEQLEIDKVGINDSTATLTQAYSGSKTQGLIDGVNTNLDVTNSQLTTKASLTVTNGIQNQINTITTQSDNYYVKCVSTDAGALLIVSSGATTGQINLTDVKHMSDYTPIAGDYVTKSYNTLNAETKGIRTAYNGTVYATAREAVVGQIGNLTGDLVAHLGCSSNLVDIFKDVNAIGRLNLSTGAIDGSVSDWRTSIFVKVEPSTQYALISFNTAKWVRTGGAWIGYYDSNKNYVSGDYSSATTGTTIPANINYMRVSMHFATIQWLPMLCLESEALLILDQTDIGLFQNRYNYLKDNNKNTIDELSLSTYNFFHTNNLEVGKLNKDTGVIDSTIADWYTTDFLEIDFSKNNPFNNLHLITYYDGMWYTPKDVLWVSYIGNKQYIKGGITSEVKSPSITQSVINVLPSTKYIRLSFSKSWLFYNQVVMLGFSNIMQPLIGTSNLTAYKKHQYILNNDILYDAYSDVELLVPNTIAVASGREFQFFYDNASLGFNTYKAQDKKIAGLNSYEDFARYAPTDVDGVSQKNCNYMLFIDKTSVGVQDITEGVNANPKAKNFVIKKVPSTAGNGVTRNVMLFGDSITAYGYYPQEVQTLFTNDVMHINLLGTLGMSGLSGNLHEGRGGWSAYKYLTTASDSEYTNAFWNPSTSAFDFSYYMAQQGFSRIDDFIMMLGINDINVQSYDSIINSFETIINSVRTYNSNCNIFICLCLLPCQMQYAASSPYVTFQKEKNRRMGLWKKIIEAFDNRESEGYYVVPVGIGIDSMNDFPTETKQLSNRNASKTITYPTDTTHPTHEGFYKIADIVYSYIKYAEM